LVIAFVAPGLLASSIGYVIHRWWLLLGAVVVGIGAILVDVSTRNLIGAGHDDRGLVAVAEIVVLLGFGVLTAAGIAIGKLRANRPRG
jgi:hypothetical protein